MLNPFIKIRGNQYKMQRLCMLDLDQHIVLSCPTHSYSGRNLMHRGNTTQTITKDGTLEARIGLGWWKASRWDDIIVPFFITFWDSLKKAKLCIANKTWEDL